MAGLAWLTVRHRPSEPRLVCDLSLADPVPDWPVPSQSADWHKLAAPATAEHLLPLINRRAPAAADQPQSTCCRRAPQSTAEHLLPLINRRAPQSKRCQSENLHTGDGRCPDLPPY